MIGLSAPRISGHVDNVESRMSHYLPVSVVGLLKSPDHVAWAHIAQRVA